MTDFKKQAIVWAITIMIAAGTIVSANQMIVNANKEETNEHEENVHMVDQELESTQFVKMYSEEVEDEEPIMLFDVYNEDGTVDYVKEIEETENCEVTKDDAEIVLQEANVDIKLSEVNESKTTGSWVDSKESALAVNSRAIEIVAHDKVNKIITLDDGTSFPYIYDDIATTTAYCHCLEVCCNHGKPEWYGKTCSGRNLLEEDNPKVLAADISRYPLGTVLFVQGYGIAIVEDIGGEIDGRDLDVYIPNHEEAEKWEMRTYQTVYVIAYGEW